MDWASLGYAVIITAVLLASLLTLGAFAGNRDRSKATATEFRQELWVHVQAGRQDTKWIFKTQQIDDKTLTELEKLGEFVGRAIERNKDVSPLAGRVAHAFTRTQTGIVYAPGSMSLVMKAKNGAPPTKDDLLNPKNLPVYFTPENLATDPQLSSAVMWSPSSHGLVIHGRDWPSAYFASLVMHEAGHGLYDLVEQRPSAHAPQESDAFIGEEVEMHQLQTLVLSKETNGAYLKAVDEFIDSRPESWCPLDIMLSLKRSDLEKMDIAAGCPDADENLRRTLVTDHTLAVAHRAIEKGRKPVQENEMIKIYGWFSHTFGGSSVEQ